jgi:hypothetical protein
MSVLLPRVPKEVWLATLDERIPAKHRTLNLKAFETGRNLTLPFAPSRREERREREGVGVGEDRRLP